MISLSSYNIYFFYHSRYNRNLHSFPTRRSSDLEYKASDKGKYVIKKVDGNLKWNNITLKRGITDAMDMWKWRGLVEEGKMSEARKNGTITMFNLQGESIAKWDFTNAWPSKLTGPSANAGNNEVAIEELEITHEGYKRVS